MQIGNVWTSEIYKTTEIEGLTLVIDNLAQLSECFVESSRN